LLGTVIVIGFLVFGLRQGLREKRQDRDDRRDDSPPAGSG
jgi:hypothetical protein